MKRNGFRVILYVWYIEIICQEFNGSWKLIKTVFYVIWYLENTSFLCKSFLIDCLIYINWIFLPPATFDFGIALILGELLTDLATVVEKSEFVGGLNICCNCLIWSSSLLGVESNVSIFDKLLSTDSLNKGVWVSNRSAVSWGSCVEGVSEASELLAPTRRNNRILSMWNKISYLYKKLLIHTTSNLFPFIQVTTIFHYLTL